MKEIMVGCIFAYTFALVVIGGVTCSEEYIASNAEARTIAAEARQEARDIDFEERQLERGCVQPESFESAHKRTD